MIARLAAAALVLASASSAPAPVSPLGRWLTEGEKAIIEIAPCGSDVCGTIREVLKIDPNVPVTDIHNPNPDLRQRPTRTLQILSHFSPDGSHWRGQIYDPRSGRTYTSFIEVRPDDTLALAGCIWKVCQTQIWRRAS
jgi:uncharacterized protein (DUF2147 family)